MSKRYKKKDPHSKREKAKYDRPIPSRELIIQFLEEHGQPVTKGQLAEQLGLEDEEAFEALRRRLKAMLRDGQLMTNRKGYFTSINSLDVVRGTVLGHREGFGFLARDDGEEDVYLSPYQMRSVFPGDKISVRVMQGRDGRTEGKLVEVLTRSTQSLVGRFRHESGVAFVEPDSKNVTQDILISSGHENNAKPGEYVSVEILKQPTQRDHATGKVIEVLGLPTQPGIEIDVIARAFNLPYQWPDSVLKESQKFNTHKINDNDIKGRKDLRDLSLVTIDGEDAKDFDDAVFCKPKQGGGWTLYVAIADVTHYVRPDTALDQEAYLRGTSVYFPGQVIPMLPEVLSNELCSLKPNVDRLCMVCEMQISAEGKVIRYTFYDAVMCSKARMTYSEVAGMFEGKCPKKYDALLSHILDLNALFKVLHRNRLERGAIEFDSVETRVEFSKNRKIKRIVPVFRNDAHRMIEECMLLANVSAANYLKAQKLHALYRNHEKPDPSRLEALRETLEGLGLTLKGGSEPAPKDYVNLLEQIKDRKEKRFIESILLRSLQQAMYEEENKGHFGLAYQMYAHFTSPIRRYPDVLVHRAIRHATNHTKQDKKIYNTEVMKKHGEHCSMTERRADEASREVMLWLKCEYMMNKIGKSFSGYVTGVTNFGLFIELEDILVEGLLHVTSLSNDYYDYDAVHHRLQGKKSGVTYRLGDKIDIIVSRVDMGARKIDFDLP